MEKTTRSAGLEIFGTNLVRFPACDSREPGFFRQRGANSFRTDLTLLFSSVFVPLFQQRDAENIDFCPAAQL